MKTFIYTNSLLVEKNPYGADFYYCVKPSDTPCHQQCDSCKSVDQKQTPFIPETLPVSGTGWIEGQEYVEGNDFERQCQIEHTGGWSNLRPDELEVYLPSNAITRQAAVLINKPTIEAQFKEREHIYNSILSRTTCTGKSIINPNNSTVEITEEKEEASKEIKPCPFCGDKPTYSWGNEHSYIGGVSNDAILECCIEMSVSFGEGVYHKDKPNTEQEAKIMLIEKWNRRVSEPIKEREQEEPYGYVFENKFYKSLDELKGQTFFEGNEPVAVYTK